MHLDIQNPERLPEDFVIFYCWQNHLPPKRHRHLISSALSNAISKVQAEIDEEVNCTLRVDSDTMGRAGAVDIADAIFSKIDRSTMIVGDVTPCLRDEANNKFYPNPNVMLEIGYGAKAHGWSRIICIFNAGSEGIESNLRKEDLPFDIRHRRLNSFICRANSGIAQAKKELEANLVAGIRAVIQEMDRGKFDRSLKVETIKREKDFRLLKSLLSKIHRTSLDTYVEYESRDSLYDNCNLFWYGFDALVCSSHCRFYDEKLERLVNELWKVWGKAVRLGGYVFSPSPYFPSQFCMKELRFWNESYENEVKEWRRAVVELPGVLGLLLDHVHHNYPEIDMDETDRNALNDLQPYLSIFDGGENNDADAVENE